MREQRRLEATPDFPKERDRGRPRTAQSRPLRNRHRDGLPRPRAAALPCALWRRARALLLDEVDVDRFLHGAVFDVLRTDPALFRAVRVDGALRTIIWPTSADPPRCPLRSRSLKTERVGQCVRSGPEAAAVCSRGADRDLPLDVELSAAPVLLVPPGWQRVRGLRRGSGRRGVRGAGVVRRLWLLHDAAGDRPDERCGFRDAAGNGRRGGGPTDGVSESAAPPRTSGPCRR